MSKVAFISGASRGIGKSIAYALAKENYDLILTCYENISMLQDLASDLSGQYNIKCRCERVDAADADAINELFDTIDSIDVLINNAGISYIGLLQDMTNEQWDRVMSVNLNSVFYTCRAAIPKMLKNKKGAIINISSMWGQAGASMEVAYSATKGGVDAFTKALAKELAPSHIRVNAISCGVVDTDMNKCFDDAEKKAIEDEIPYGRYATSSEIADVVVNIAKMPTYMTGQIIGVNGGYV